MTVHSIESLSDYEKSISEAKPEQLILIDFYATWCPPCKAIAPFLDELSDEHVDVVFLKVDVDKVKEVAIKEDVKSMPTFMCYVDGVVTCKFVGADKDRIIDVIKNKGVSSLPPASNTNYTRIFMWIALAVYYCWKNGMVEQWFKQVQNYSAFKR